MTDVACFDPCKERKGRATGRSLKPLGPADVGDGALLEADERWAREAAAAYSDPDHLRAEVAENANTREREKTRPLRTDALWDEIRGRMEAQGLSF
jgi:hypothetical protein